MAAASDLCYSYINNEAKMAPKHLTIKDHFVYGSASVGDSVAYSTVTTFFMFFLTTTAGVKPVTAGAISAIGSIWNAVANPLLGFISDRIRSPFGRRRKMMLLFAVPLCFLMPLLFTAVPFSNFWKSIWYGILLMLYWTCYTGYFVPYLALGAEYTDDYNDRTVMRLFASLFNMLGHLICMTAPTLLHALLMDAGLSDAHAWTLSTAALGVAAFSSIAVTVAFSKGKDADPDSIGSASGKSPVMKTDSVESDALPDADMHAAAKEKAQHPAFSPAAIAREYLSVARLAPVKYLILASTCILITFSMFLADMVYFLTFMLGYSAAKSTLILISRSLIGLALLPVTAKLTARIDKRYTLLCYYGVSAVLLLTCRFFWADNLLMLSIYVIGMSGATLSYWQIMPSVYYDICEYDELMTGKQRQGTIVSFQGLVEAVAAGIGSLLLGIILDFAGFDRTLAEQSHLTKEWIFNCTTVVPLCIIAVACYAIYRYPITREVYTDIVKKLHEKK